MKLMRMVAAHIRRLNPMSKLLVRAGFLTMFSLYITAFFAYILSGPADYLRSMAVYRAALEAAPASFAAIVVVAFLCDLVYRNRFGDGEDHDR